MIAEVDPNLPSVAVEAMPPIDPAARAAWTRVGVV